jgi:hypothetical protein
MAAYICQPLYRAMDMPVIHTERGCAGKQFRAKFLQFRDGMADPLIERLPGQIVVNTGHLATPDIAVIDKNDP